MRVTNPKGCTYASQKSEYKSKKMRRFLKSFQNWQGRKKRSTYLKRHPISKEMLRDRHVLVDLTWDSFPVAECIGE